MTLRMTDPPKQGDFDPATLEIIWSRLLAIADEEWSTIWRTSYSTIISAAHDFGCDLMDEDGGSLAHAHRSMPVFNITLPRVTQAILKKFPKETIRPGDVFCCNDPWLCAGHVPDFAIVTPVFKGDRLIAWAGSICHQADMGGAHRSKAAREVYEEGLMIPPMKMFDQGQRNNTLFEILAQNLRTPDLVIGDMEAQLSANALGGQRVLGLIEEYNIPDMRLVASAIQSRSETAMRNAISALPDGEYQHCVPVDSADDQIFDIVCTVFVHGDELTVDYAGTRDQAEFGGINCTLTYTTAQTHYGIKYLLTPSVPNNEGCFRPIQVTAPRGSIMNCTFPASVSVRTRTGWFLHDAVAGALAKVIPDRVRAGSGMLQSIMMRGRDTDDRAYHAQFMVGSGQGAAMGQDGMAAWIFPSSASGVPCEILEQNFPLVVHERRILPNTGGEGRWRGGPGASATFSRLPGFEGSIRLWLNPSHYLVPPQGLLGGQAGSLSSILINGQPADAESDVAKYGWGQLRTDDDQLTFQVPGGGGIGDPAERDPAALERDREDGYVTD